MDSKKTTSRERAKRLAQRLERHPDLLERFDSIMDLAEDDEHAAFDEIEKLLIEQVRRLGNETLESWVKRREQALGEQMRENPGVQQREKKR